MIRRRFAHPPRLIFLAVLAGSLMGCDLLAPTQSPPSVATPAAFRGAPAGAQWPAANWWQGFSSAELSDLVGQAQANNPDLGAALARLEQARASARIADAALFPSLDGGADVKRTRAGTGRSGVTTTTYGGSLNAAYQVDLFGANRSASAAAAKRVAASQFDREAVALTVVGDVARGYLQALALRDRLALARQNLVNAERVLAILDRRRAVGTLSDLELAQQRSTVASQRAAIPGLEQAERAAINALAVLLGRAASDFDIAGRTLNDLTLPVIAAGLPSDLLLRRPDIRAAEADLQASSEDIASAWAQRFPRIDLTAAGSTISQRLSSLLSPASILMQIAAGLTVPIFEGGKLKATQQLQEARYRELVALYAKTVLTAFSDVETALSAAALFQRQYDLSRLALDEARRAFTLAETRYNAGVADFLSVLDAQRSVLSASDALVQANLARYSAMVDLYIALGGGFGN